MKNVLLLISIVIASSSYAQFNPNFYNPQFNPFSVCTPPSQFALDLFLETLETSREYADIPPVQFCQNDFVPNAYAQMFGIPQQIQAPNGFYYMQMVPVYRIDYNPNFMGQSDITVNNDLALIGILAHEIGHIEHFAILNNPVDVNYWEANYDLNVPQEKELRADEFAGFVLAKMGASIEDVVDTQRTIFSLHVNPQYADSITRLRRMFDGYIAGYAGNLSNNELTEIIQSQSNLATQYMRWR